MSWQKKNFVRVLFYSGKKRDERIPDVPTITEIFEKEKVAGEQPPRRPGDPRGGIIRSADYLRTRALPADRVNDTARSAFDQAMKDPELLAETQKQKMDVDPENGENLRKARSTRSCSQPPEVIARVKKILSN